MTFKFDSYIVPDTPLKIMDLPDNIWVGLQAPAENTTGIFIANSAANILAGNKRAKLNPGVGLPFEGTNDDELWVMAEDNSEPDLIVFCADEIGAITGTLGTGIIPAAPVAPDVAGHWGSAASNGNDFSVTGVSVNANNKYWIAIALEDDGTIDSVSGMGLTWVWEEEAKNAGDCEIYLYRGDGTPTGTGAVNVNISGASSRAAMVVAVSGADNANATIDDDPKHDGSGTTVTGTACNVETDGLFLGWITEDNNRNFTPNNGDSFVAKYGVGTDVAVHLVKFTPTATGTRNISGTLDGSADWCSITQGIRKAP